MKNLLTLVALVGLGLSTIGCTENKPAPAPAAADKGGDKGMPAEPAPATPETSKEGEVK